MIRSPKTTMQISRDDNREEDNEILSASLPHGQATVTVRQSLSAMMIERNARVAQHNAMVKSLLSQCMKNCVVVNKVLRLAISNFTPGMEDLMPEHDAYTAEDVDASVLNTAQMETYALLKVLLLGLMERQEEYEEVMWELNREVEAAEEESTNVVDHSKEKLEHAIEELATVLVSSPSQGEEAFVKLRSGMSTENPMYEPKERSLSAEEEEAEVAMMKADVAYLRYDGDRIRSSNSSDGYSD